ncbi:MAG: 3'(2'),5'-bisphosphate nucleotidase CysQ [Ekhidna sp.]
MNLDRMMLNDLCSIAKEAAVAAGTYIQSQANKNHTKKEKKAGNSVASQVITQVDIEAQRIILSHLKSTIERYDLGLLTEEAADDQSRLHKDYFWCIDPMDGTLPYTEGKSGYAVSIALVTLEGDPLIGVVYLPDSEHCFTSIKGGGVLLDNESFIWKKHSAPDALHVYLDRSVQKEAYFDELIKQLEKWSIEHLKLKVEYHIGFGAVCNAIGVLNATIGCYFKFPKEQKGGGSIWDFASSRLFFEELNLPVSNANGELLHLNRSETTFMNEIGIVFSTDPVLAKFIIRLGSEIV